MKSYAQSGGAVEPINHESVAVARASIDKKFSGVPPGYTVLPCGKIVPILPSLPPPSRPLPPQAPNDPPCVLLKNDLQCSHGRMAGSERILMVVAGEKSEDDTVTASLAMNGGCGAHPAWDHGPAPAVSGKSSSFHFNVRAPARLSDAPMLRWWRLTPVTTRISATACSGISGDCDVRAYPPGEVTLGAELGAKFKPTEKEAKDKREFKVAASYEYSRGGTKDKFEFDFWKIPEVFQKTMDFLGDKLVGFNLLDDDSDPVAQLMYGQGESRPIKKDEFKWSIAVSVAASSKSQWLEDPASWKAYCETEIKFGASPLFEISGELPIWAVPIPPKLSRWVKLGLFFRPTGSLQVSVARKWSLWPDDGKEVVLNWEGEGEGEIKLAIFAKLSLCSGDFVSGSATGTSSLSVKGTKLKEPQFGLHFAASTGKLSAKLTGEALWGLMSFEREFEILEGWKDFLKYDWRFEG